MVVPVLSGWMRPWPGKSPDPPHSPCANPLPLPVNRCDNRPTSMTTPPTLKQRLLTAILLSAPRLPIAGCVYHAVGAASHIPGGVSTIDVPIFATHVLNYNTEVVFTQAIVRELNTRTSYRIVPGENAAADARLSGTILT